MSFNFVKKSLMYETTIEMLRLGIVADTPHPAGMVAETGSRGGVAAIARWPSHFEWPGRVDLKL
jgi:hypothetical protein